MNRTVLISIFIGLIGCSNAKEYQIKFDNVDWLQTGDKVVCNGLVVGEVKKLKIDDDKKVLALVTVDKDLKLTKDSRFTIKSELIGIKYIDIELADNKDLLNEKEIQIGQVQPPDTTGFKKLTLEQKDSLVQHDPVFRLADTVLQILRNKETKNKKGVSN